MAKKRKFAEGGSPDMDVANDIANESFSAAFKRNRAGGNKTFEWRGKKYTTEMAKGPKAEQESTSGGPPTRARRAEPVPALKKFSDASTIKRTPPMMPPMERRGTALTASRTLEEEKYKKGGKVKKYAEGGNVDYSANEVSRMKPATPENTKRLQERARKSGASQASIDRATKGVVPKFAKGGGVESRGKTKGRFV